MVQRRLGDPTDPPIKYGTPFDSLWLYTMNRCHSMRARLALAASLSLSFLGAMTPSASLAQQTIRREVPQDVVLGQMKVVAPPVIQMDGNADRFSPGVRIRDAHNLLVLSGSLAGSTVPVVYKRDVSGLVHEVWLLTGDEYEKLASAGSDTGKFTGVLGTLFSLRQ